MSLPSPQDIQSVARDVLRELTGVAGGGEPRRAQGELISEKEVRAAKAAGTTVLEVAPGTLVTPLARDAAWECGIQLRFAGEPARSTDARPQDRAQDAGPAPAEGGVIALGSDHGGFALKGAILAHLEGRGLATVDLGTHSKESCDYPDFAAKVASAVALGEASWGILIDGAGIGSCMAAGKVPGVLAATCHDARTAKNSREHNGANVLCLGAGSLDSPAALSVVDAWVDEPFAGGRHARRVNKIRALEQSFLGRR